eukprot:jgi/Botrbrau1/8003/Bobra.384_2s0029.2
MDQFVSSVSAFCNLLEEWEGSALMGSHLLSSASAVLGVPRPNDSSTERKFEAVRETKYIRNALDQAMSQRLIEYMQEGSRAGAFHRRSLQQLMDALSGLGNTVDLLKATSQALVDLASDADQVVRQLLSKDGGAKRGFGGEGQPHEGADARMQEDDADKCPVINAVSAALCMREVSDGVHQCTAIMDRIVELVGPDTPADDMTAFCLMWDLRPFVVPAFETFLLQCTDASTEYSRRHV